ncbi:MAG TPA: hypothetical protein VFY84_08135, partial [Jiangellales bacterium]|nr:hypothetical protein [Jiangellales bacterium]
RFDRRRYDAARTIKAFSGRLRQQVDLDTLTAELLGVVDQTMQPTQASYGYDLPTRRPRTSAVREHPARLSSRRMAACSWTWWTVRAIQAGRVRIADARMPKTPSVQVTRHVHVRG